MNTLDRTQTAILRVLGRRPDVRAEIEAEHETMEREKAAGRLATIDTIRTLGVQAGALEERIAAQRAARDAAYGNYAAECAKLDQLAAELNALHGREAAAHQDLLARHGELPLENQMNEISNALSSIGHELAGLRDAEAWDGPGRPDFAMRRRVRMQRTEDLLRYQRALFAAHSKLLTLRLAPIAADELAARIRAVMAPTLPLKRALENVIAA